MTDRNPRRADSSSINTTSRRDVFRMIGAAGLGFLASGTGTSSAVAAERTDSAADEQRLSSAMARRQTTIKYNLEDRSSPDQPQNDDENRFAPGGEYFDEDGNYIASFAKGLPHREDGEVEPGAYETLLKALNPESTETFEDVTEAGDRPLVNPEAAFSFNQTGIDPTDAYMDPAPAFDSKETAAEMVELYWQALLRDVKFSDYENSNITRAAADELSGLAEFTGPKENGEVTPGTLFRDTLSGTTEGPYISQFLLRDFQRGARSRDQRVLVPQENRDFLTDFEEWLDVQEGAAPDGAVKRTTPGSPPVSVSARTGRERHIITGRDLATYVRVNNSPQPYLVAALILQAQGPPLDNGVPTNDNVPDSFVDYGRTEYQAVVTGIVDAHLRAAWYHKWRVHRRLRPEEYGGRVHQIKTGATIDGQDASERYPVDNQLLDSEALKRTRERFGTWLLPQAYPEGSPTHPSYPAGHAVTAGSCATVLKAFFDEEATIANPVRAVEQGNGRGRGRGGPTGTRTELEPIDADLTVRGEIHKLASNVSIGRNWAGIHYRTDATNAYRLGERIAVSVLRDRLTQKNENAYGKRGSFELTTFDGVEITITPDGVMPSTAFEPPLY